MLLDHKEERKEILLQMDELQTHMRKMNSKINLIVKATTGFKFMEKETKNDLKPPTSTQEVPLFSTLDDDAHSP